MEPTKTTTQQISQNTILRDALAILNSAVSEFQNIRVTDYDQFHSEVHKTLIPILEPLGMHYRIWTIYNTDTGDQYFKANIDRTLDKNAGASVRGRVNKFWFELTKEISGPENWQANVELDSIATLPALHAVAAAESHADSCNQWQERLRKELNEVVDKVLNARSRKTAAQSELSEARRRAGKVWEESGDGPRTMPWQVKEFFVDNPAEQFAYPCGHTDICGYVMNSSEARQIERGIETKCPRCGSNVDREFYVRREQIQTVTA